MKRGLVEAVTALLDKTAPTPEERVLRVIARTSANPAVVLSWTDPELRTALARDCLEWEQDRRRWVIFLEPGLRHELRCVVSQLVVTQLEGNVASWISASPRVDANSAARSRLRRAWQAWWASQRQPDWGSAPALQDVSQALGVERLEVLRGEMCRANGVEP